MIILGINGGVRLGYQDVSAVLLRDGKILAAVEEERLSRIKHSPGQLPYRSIQEVLSIAGIEMRDVDVVATHGSTWGDGYEAMLKRYFKYTFNASPKVIRYHHHLCHAASAYYASGYEDAMVLTTDASGDSVSMQRAIGCGSELAVVEQVPRTNSLGILYSMMTQFCGFTRDSDEYKLMGLAPYGNPNRVDLSFLVDLSGKGFKVNQSYMFTAEPGQPQPSRQQAIFNPRLIDELGAPRIPESELSQLYKDMAASTQQLLEEVLCKVVREFHEETGIRKVCLAGGVALNCAANKKILELDFIDDIFVQPASSDAGISLGAAYLASTRFDRRPERQVGTKLGRNYSEAEVADELSQLGISFNVLEDSAEVAADLLNRDKVIGWFNGRAEFGPRALGSRSILGSATNPDMQELINRKIKFRESFRPFCPAVIKEDFKKAFSSPAEELPYMTVNVDVRSDQFPAITHVDGTARVQTVNDSDASFHQLLNLVGERQGISMVVNTSFNRMGEPMVYSVRDAVSCFFGSGLDSLFIGSIFIEKK
jgi:carbamoyltransferase